MKNVDFNNSYLTNSSDAPYYFPTDRDELDAVRYYGFTTVKGTWYIQQDTLATGATRLAKGKINYPANWTNRASLTYYYPYEVVNV